LIAIDTNVLAYAHRNDSPYHGNAFQVLKSLCEGRANWGIPWPCIHEFIGVVTNQKAYPPATTTAEAFAQIEAWMASDKMKLLGEGQNHFHTLKELAIAGKVQSAKIHDARIAAICLQHGVTELWTADRDFSRFPKLKTRNPLVG
jgi:uncharacterized protein